MPQVFDGEFRRNINVDTDYHSTRAEQTGGQRYGAAAGDKVFGYAADGTPLCINVQGQLEPMELKSLTVTPLEPYNFGYGKDYKPPPGYKQGEDEFIEHILMSFGVPKEVLAPQAAPPPEPEPSSEPSIRHLKKKRTLRAVMLDE